MTETFAVLKVFRPAKASGPILVGRATTDSLALGDVLVSTTNSSDRAEVIGIEVHTSPDGTKSVMVSPDLGSGLAAGATFVVEPRDIADPD